MKINCKTSEARRSIICCAVDFQENAFAIGQIQGTKNNMAALM